MKQWIVLCLLLSLNLSHASVNQVKRYLKMEELAYCIKRGSLTNPVIVQGQININQYKVAVVKYTNYLDTDGSEGGSFEFRGTDLKNETMYWGAITEKCQQTRYLSPQNNLINCLGTNQGRLVKEGNHYIAYQFENLTSARKIVFEENECSIWPHGQPTNENKVILFTVPFNRYCVIGTNLLFKINKNSSITNPLQILFGGENSDCIYGLLSTPTNHEFWMDGRNELFSDEEVDPKYFKKEQFFDIDEDGDLDLIKIEENYNHELYPKGAWSFVLYRK